MTHLPEGAELYEWIQAPEYVGSVFFYRNDDLIAPIDGPLPEVTAEPEVIEVKPMAGPYGWSEELRIGVVFGPYGPPQFEASRIPDMIIKDLANRGAWLLYLDRINSLIALFNELLKEIDEGEEWKDG